MLVRIAEQRMPREVRLGSRNERVETILEITANNCYISTVSIIVRKNRSDATSVVTTVLIMGSVGF